MYSGDQNLDSKSIELIPESPKNDQYVQSECQILDCDSNGQYGGSDSNGQILKKSDSNGQILMKSDSNCFIIMF